MRKGIIIILIVFSNICFGQSTTPLIDSVGRQNLMKQSFIMANALLNKDYTLFTNYTYIKLIEIAGGFDKSVKLIEKEINALINQGITFESVNFEEPTVFVKAGYEIHTIIPQTIILKIPRGKLKTISYLIAITKDNGKTWQYVDTANLNTKNIKDILPNYNFDLSIPASTNPVLIEEN
jgi:hypothetical protein